MEINEVKVGDTVTFKHNKKQVTGKVIYRHDSADNKKAERAALMGHVNVQVMDNKSYPVTVHVSKLKPAMQEETIMENSNVTVLDLIDQIDSGNNLEAEKTFNDLLQSRIEAVLDEVKVEVASSMFNTEDCADCNEEEIQEGGNAANKAKGRAYVKSLGVSPKSPKGWSSGHETDAEYDRRTVRAGREKLKKEEVEVTSEALKGSQHKIDANKNGKVDAHDFKMLRSKKRGMKEEVEQVDEASYSAKKAAAGKDIGKKGKMFGKIAKKASRKYGKERGAKIAGAVLAKLRKKGK